MNDTPTRAETVIRTKVNGTNATNQTTNYGYPIFAPNDIPGWLTSWNNTMSAIDADLKNIQTQVTKNQTDTTTLEEQASTASTQIDTLQQQVSGIDTKVNGNSQNISALQNTTNNLSLQLTQANNAISNLQANQGNVYRGTLSKGENTLAIQIGNFDSNSLVDIYASVYGVYPESMELRPASGGQPNLCVTTWETMNSDLNVAVKIINPNPVSTPLSKQTEGGEDYNATL